LDLAVRSRRHVYILQYADSATRNYEMHDGHCKDIKRYEHYAARAATVSSQKGLAERMAWSYLENHIGGTPKQRIAKLRYIAD
jgi:hypothetical protein